MTKFYTRDGSFVELIEFLPLLNYPNKGFDFQCWPEWKIKNRGQISEQNGEKR